MQTYSNLCPRCYIKMSTICPCMAIYGHCGTIKSQSMATVAQLNATFFNVPIYIISIKLTSFNAEHVLKDIKLFNNCFYIVNVPLTVQIVIIILEEQNKLITINFTLFVYATFSPNVCLKKSYVWVSKTATCLQQTAYTRPPYPTPVPVISVPTPNSASSRTHCPMRLSNYR